jgi:tetratricopeptide (TPR) repeat protein
MSIKNGDDAAISRYAEARLRISAGRALCRTRLHALWLSLMTLSNPVDLASPCPCGSGLRAARCCGLDWTAPWPEPGPAPEVGHARAALAAGAEAEAERLLVELLERSPKHIGAIALLYELRMAQGRTGAAEALLKRIVRLDPNNLPMTQALALMLFTRGALAEADHHARNAVRIAPTDAIHDLAAQTHLGLIGLIFPEARVIHLLRHPLDVVLSVFSNHLTHGFYCAYDLTSIARHYVLVMDLVEHYRREMALKYMAVRYEDVIDRQDESVRKMLAHVGAPYDKRCLDFQDNRRYARTASYAQVTEKLYDRSRYRYRAYRDELRPVIPILEPVIRRLGYTVDQGGTGSDKSSWAV